VDSHKSHGDGGSFGSEGEFVTVAGTVLFFWDSGNVDDGHTLVNIEADNPLLPDTYELTGELRAAVIDLIEEGGRIEIDYVVVHREIVDLDGVTTDGHKPRILDVRIGDLG
jgi:hypothetical protein